MTATGHAIIGTVIAAKIGNPMFAFPLAILSHLAADAFPHWDTGTNMKKHSWKKFVIGSFIDLGISLTLPFYLFSYLFPQTNLLYGYSLVIAAQAFDWATAPYVFLKWKFPPLDLPYRIQKIFDNRLDRPWGIIGQVGILIFLVIMAKVT